MSDQVAYLAGFFDGEGCITLTPSGEGSNPHWKVAVSVCQKDVRPLKLMQARYGGWLDIEKSGRPRAIWRYRLSTASAISMLKEMLPYLTVKKEQAECVLEYEITLLKPAQKRAGVPEWVHNKRWDIKRKLDALKHVQVAA